MSGIALSMTMDGVEMVIGTTMVSMEEWEGARR